MRGAIGAASLGRARELALERLHHGGARGDHGGRHLDVDRLARGIRELRPRGRAQRGVVDGGHREGDLARVGGDDRARASPPTVTAADLVEVLARDGHLRAAGERAPPPPRGRSSRWGRRRRRASTSGVAIVSVGRRAVGRVRRDRGRARRVAVGGCRDGAECAHAHDRRGAAEGDRAPERRTRRAAVAQALGAVARPRALHRLLGVRARARRAAPRAARRSVRARPPRRSAARRSASGSTVTAACGRGIRCDGDGDSGRGILLGRGRDRLLDGVDR